MSVLDLVPVWLVQDSGACLQRERRKIIKHNDQPISSWESQALTPTGYTKKVVGEGSSFVGDSEEVQV